MPAKKSSKKSGGSKKGGAGGRAGGSKKGGSKKGGTRGFGSVLSSVGNIATTVGGLAGSITGTRRELSASVGSSAGINDIVRELKKKFTEAGCPGCRSGIDRIIFKDIVAGGGGGR